MKIDGGAGGDSGTLLTAQTITSESVSTTTTTHITKVKQSQRLGKGGSLQTRCFLVCSFVHVPISKQYTDGTSGIKMPLSK